MADAAAGQLLAVASTNQLEPPTMSKKTAEAAPAAVAVRALIDLPAHGLLAGQAGEVPAECLEPLKATGAVDDHPDAVAYASAI